jgi:hypothetical protein
MCTNMNEQQNKLRSHCKHHTSLRNETTFHKRVLLIHFWPNLLLYQEQGTTEFNFFAFPYYTRIFKQTKNEISTKIPYFFDISDFFDKYKGRL